MDKPAIAKPDPGRVKQIGSSSTQRDHQPIVKPSSSSSLSNEAQEVANLPDNINTSSKKKEKKTAAEMLEDIKDKKKKEELSRVNNKINQK